MLLTLCFCWHITVILSSGVAAMSTATMGISVNPTNSPTLRASPVTSTVYTVLSASATLPLFFVVTVPTVPVAHFAAVCLATTWVLTLAIHVLRAPSMVGGGVSRMPPPPLMPPPLPPCPDPLHRLPLAANVVPCFHCHMFCCCNHPTSVTACSPPVAVHVTPTALCSQHAPLPYPHPAAWSIC